MKRILHLAGLVLALVVLVAPRAEASVGTVYNGFLSRCDVNHDGSVTATDITIVYNYILGTADVSSYNCDVNYDGSVTSVDITMLYNVILNGGFYNSIFDAFNLSVANYINREYYKFTWDDVTTLGYNVTDPMYMLVIGTDDTFTTYCCLDVSGTSKTISYESMSEMFKTELGWTSPGDVPASMNLVARVEVKLDNGDDVIISNEKSFLFLPQLTFESSQPIKLWWLVGSFVGNNPWDNSSPYSSSNGLVPLYPVQGATYNQNGEGPLEYYGYFPTGGEFKILEDPGSWEKVIGGGNENGGQIYSGNTSSYPDNIIINQGGYYKLELNTVDKTMTMTRLSDTQVSYSTITMPGYYQNWDVTSNAMTALGTNNHDWYSILTLDSDSELKFAPGSWDYDWGTNEFPYGKGYQGGYNIPAKQGGYYVYFNDLSGDYMFIDGENGLPSTNYLMITKYDVGDFVNLAWDYASGTTIKLCDISTDLEGPYQLCFDNQSVAIDQDGKVDINEFKNAVFSAYNRPRTGGCHIYYHVEGVSGHQTITSNTIDIPVQIENYSIVVEGYDSPIEMTPTGLNTYVGKIPYKFIDIYFKIKPESSSDAGDLITSPYDYNVTATNGSFGFGKQGYFLIPDGHSYDEFEVNINLGYKTYTIEGYESLSPLTTIWQAGVANNWGNPADGLALNNDGTYTGYMFLNTDFKFRQYEDSWDGTNWGTETYQSSYMSGYLVENGYNLYAPQGFYKVDVNLDESYYNLSKISSVSIIGAAVPTGTQWATDVDLTYNQSTGAWETNMVLNKGEFKFRADHDWNLNWGGTLNNIVEGGANLSVASPGAYHVEFFLTYNGNSHAVLTRL
ncbi:MAG: SusF/SusE family outer membrane protein [Muribaculaceae bacterium]|nr:SusF/SusE family outer membrane protein [Muribaculaceae bacterium]